MMNNEDKIYEMIIKEEYVYEKIAKHILDVKHPFAGMTCLTKDDEICLQFDHVIKVRNKLAFQSVCYFCDGINFLNIEPDNANTFTSRDIRTSYHHWLTDLKTKYPSYEFIDDAIKRSDIIRNRLINSEMMLAHNDPFDSVLLYTGDKTKLNRSGFTKDSFIDKNEIIHQGYIYKGTEGILGIDDSSGLVFLYYDIDEFENNTNRIVSYLEKVVNDLRRDDYTLVSKYDYSNSWVTIHID